MGRPGKRKRGADADADADVGGSVGSVGSVGTGTADNRQAAASTTKMPTLRTSMPFHPVPRRPAPAAFVSPVAVVLQGPRQSADEEGGAGEGGAGDDGVGDDGAPATVAVADPGVSPRMVVAQCFGGLAIRGRVEEEEDDDDARTPKRHKMQDDDDDDDDDAATRTPKRPKTSSVDPLRAALTWQDDEITVYDPHDADDDGEGVNGIGFRPTRAVARARARRRRQQLAAYRRREARDARAARASRPRGGASDVAAAADGVAGDGAAGDGAAGDGAAGAAAATNYTTDPGIPPECHPLGTPPRDTGGGGPPPTPTPTPRRRVRFLETGPTTFWIPEPEAGPVATF